MLWQCFFAVTLFAGAVVGHNIPLSRQQQLRAMLQDECALYGHGDEETVEKAEQGVLDFSDCMLGLIDLKLIQQLQLVTPDNINQGVIAFVQSSCNKKSDFLTCYNSMADSMASCVEPETGVSRSKKLMVDLIDYVCNNQAQNFAEFINGGALTCIQEKQVELMSCSRPATLLEAQKKRTTITISEACNTFEQMTDCLLGELGTCPNRSTAKFVSRVLQIFDTNSRCRTSDPDMEIHVHSFSNNNVERNALL